MSRRDVCLAMRSSFQTSLLDKAACIVAWRILEDGACTIGWRLGQPPLPFVLGKHGTQALRVFLMHAYLDLHHDFVWLNQAAGWRDELSSLIKSGLAALTKPALTIAQVEFITVIALHERIGDLIVRLQIAATRIQHLNPLQHLPQITVVRPGITEHATA